MVPILRGAFIVALLLLHSGPLHAQVVAPRLQSGNFSYLGAFRLFGVGAQDPACSQAPYAVAGTGHAGRGLALRVDPTTSTVSLLVPGGTAPNGRACVGQFGIPASFSKSIEYLQLPVAPLLQNFVEISGSSISSASIVGAGKNNCEVEGCILTGVLWRGSRFIFNVGIDYTIDPLATPMGFLAATDLDSPGATQYVALTGPRVQRLLSGPMVDIPPEFRSLLGGSAAVMHCCVSVVSNSSAGPAIHAFTPESLETFAERRAVTLLDYQIPDRQLCSLFNRSDECEQQQSTVYNLTTNMRGFAFVPGSRSLMIVGSQGIGPYCYGDKVECGGTYEGKEPRAEPNRMQVWLYDINDLVAVRQGRRAPWSVAPYSVFELAGYPSAVPSRLISGAAFDPGTRRLYVMNQATDPPRVDVFQVSTEQFPEPSAPKPPTSLRAN